MWAVKVFKLTSTYVIQSYDKWKKWCSMWANLGEDISSIPDITWKRNTSIIKLRLAEPTEFPTYCWLSLCISKSLSNLKPPSRSLQVLIHKCTRSLGFYASALILSECKDTTVAQSVQGMLNIPKCFRGFGPLCVCPWQSTQSSHT